MTENKFNSTKIFISLSVYLINNIYMSFIVGLIPVLTEKFHLSIFFVSILTSINFATFNFFQPFFGYFSDKYGIRYFFIIGLLASSIFVSLLGILPNYYLILVFLFLGNLGAAAILPTTAAAANYFGGARKGFSNSIISIGGSIGFSFGSLFAIAITRNLGLGFTPIAAIPGIITALFMIRFAPSTASVEYQKKKAGLFKKFKSIEKTKLKMLALIVFAAYSRDIVLISMFSFMPLYFTGRGTGIVNFGYIIMAFCIAGGIGGLIAGFYSDRIEKKTLVIQACLIMSIPLFYLIFKSPLSVSIVLFVLAGFFAISTQPLTIRVAQEIFPGNVSLASSVIMGGSGGLAAVTVILIGKIADNVGMVRTINYVLIIPVVASLLLFLYPLVRREYKV